MLTEDAKALLQGGSGLIVALTKADGRPFATRAWGCDLDDSGEGGWLLVRAVDMASFGLEAGESPDIPIAVTASDIRTLFSVQVKGTLVEVASAADRDVDRKDAYCDLFIDAVVETDGTPIEVVERWRATDGLVRCRIAFREAFIQTPGPGAGAALEGAKP